MRIHRKFHQLFSRLHQRTSGSQQLSLSNEIHLVLSRTNRAIVITNDIVLPTNDQKTSIRRLRSSIACWRQSTKPSDILTEISRLIRKKYYRWIFQEEQFKQRNHPTDDIDQDRIRYFLAARLSEWRVHWVLCSDGWLWNRRRYWARDWK